MMMRKRLPVVFLAASVLLFAAGARKLPKPGWNLFSKDQDVQLGREAAAEIEKQMTVVQDRALTEYINRIGTRLVDRGGLEKYPFSFKVVKEDSINAFALPGGPMYVHTGLISAAESEAQLAGVLAHELSHVVLRHGTNQASKSQGLALIATLGGALAGGGSSMVGTLAQLGIGLGANSVLMKYSRGAESDADLLGMHTMAKAGYDPLEMARFFEKLQAQAGSGNSKFAEFFSSHPNPGNRVKAVEKEIPYLTKASYGQTEGDLTAMKQIVAKLPAAPKKAQGQTAQSTPKASSMPQIQVTGRTKTYQGGGVTFSYPEGFEQQGDGSNGVTLAPKAGIVTGQDGASAIGYGIMAGTSQPQGGQVSLGRDTEAFLKQVSQSNQNVKVEQQSQKILIGGSNAYVTTLSSESPFPNTREIDVVITVDRGTALYYFIFVSPQSDYQRFESIYQSVARSISFTQ
ncbi:MAG TPA: M48 family metallopeptidase [Bryobacteraceae bacterium]|nr:M48 family metallopeptidase [Bryobacteraceae bacterium]HPT29092.1 M48 family metallopeptidase [Bryobacteraceae bacterium]